MHSVGVKLVLSPRAVRTLFLANVYKTWQYREYDHNRVNLGTPNLSAAGSTETSFPYSPIAFFKPSSSHSCTLLVGDDVRAFEDVRNVCNEAQN
jgi:hypothetical protein